MTSWIRSSLLAALACVVLAPAAAADKLTLGIFAYRPKEILEQRYQPLADYLAAALGDTRVELRVLDQDEIHEALARQQLDLVFTNPAHYVQLRTRFNLTGALATLVSMDSGVPTSQLGGVIIARRETTRPATLAELRGARIAFPGSRFLGGYQTQAYELLLAGLHLPRDARLQAVASHDAVVQAVLAGTVDAGFVRSGLIEQLSREGKLDPQQLRLINAQSPAGFPYRVSTRLYPEWAFVALPHVDSRQVRVIASSLMLLEAEHPVARAAGIAGFVPPADYLPVEQIMRTLRAPPFDQAPPITAEDIWAQHRPTVLVAALALAVVGLLLFLLAKRNRALAAGSAAINRERQRLSEVLAATGEGIWEWDIGADRLTHNQRWAAILGAAEASAPASRGQLAERVHAADRPAMLERLEHCLAGHGAYRSEYRIRRDDGSELWVLDQGDVVARDDTGRPARMVGSLTDIGERKEQESSLRKSERELNRAQAVAHIGSWYVDIDNRRLHWSAETYRIFGVAEGTPIDYAGFLARVHPDDAAAVDAAWLAALAGAPYEITHRIVVDGRIKWVQERAELHFDEAGQLASGTGTVEDVTERTRLEHELDRRMHELTAILDNSSVGIALMQSRRLVWANRRLSEIIGYTQEEIAGRGTEAFFPTPAEHEAVSADSIAALRRGERFVGECRLRRQDGVQVWAQVYGKAINPQDLSEGIIWVIEDISQQRQALEDLRQAMQLAEAASRAKSEFLANMSHEIRTPMNAVLGLAQLLERETMPSEQREMVTRIRNAGRSLLRILNDILDFSKIEAGQLHIERHPFALPPLLEQLDFMFGSMARDKGLAWRIEHPGGLPGRLLGDGLRLEQALSNLIANAIKFTGAGEVVLRVRPAQAEATRLRLRFEVSDTGIGIPEEVVPALFQPFTQADGSTTRRFGGTGLGLAICKRLIELMGGTLGVVSAPQRGSTFWFELPFELAADGEAALPRIGGPAPGSGPRLAGLRVLLVDDSQANQVITEQMLRREGARVTLAGNGQEAIERLLAHPGEFDVVVMDMQMPVMDGFAATRAIRNELALPELPVVAYSAGVLREEQQAMREAGVNDILAKPVDMERMVQILARWRPRPPPASAALAVAASGPTPPAPAAIDRAQLTQRLDELQHMLDNSMLSAKPATREIEALLAGHPPAAEFAAVGEAVRKLRFREAGMALAAFRAGLATAD
ncbi:MAG TPA: PhnD/SsuA/transferrin family substrate-binding protein [Azospira sp.]|nr:PhnD/SsuA/transferrin family substrate-binding protein [Azospira sp.]